MLFLSLTAPTAYQAEKVVLKTTPSYSFGLKITREKYSDTPGTKKTILTFIPYRHQIHFLRVFFLAPCAYMPEKVILDHIPTYLIPKPIIIQPQGYIKYVTIGS